jgi:hypothetical protein
MTERQFNPTLAELNAGNAETLAIYLRAAEANAALAQGSDREAAYMVERIAQAEKMLTEARHELVRLERSAGRTWAEVGDLLGISRQAAQQRFGGSSV